MSRWKASGLHLLISVGVAILTGSLIYFVWYPPPYFDVAGGSTLMLVIMGVDIVIGPFLTLAELWNRPDSGSRPATSHPAVHGPALACTRPPLSIAASAWRPDPAQSWHRFPAQDLNRTSPRRPDTPGRCPPA